MAMDNLIAQKRNRLKDIVGRASQIAQKAGSTLAPIAGAMAPAVTGAMNIGKKIGEKLSGNVTRRTLPYLPKKGIKPGLGEMAKKLLKK